jgi:hypothetical protein
MSVWSSHRSTHNRVRPELEALEERLVLNNRFVTPGAVDNVTTFATLKAALTTPGLQAGDVIQIEPGSNPGHISNGDIPALKNLTIQGDPAADVQSIPYFYTDTPVFINLPRQGFTLKNVEMDTLNGTFEFVADGNILSSRVRNDFAGISVALAGTSGAVIADSYFENTYAANQSNSLVTVQPAAGSHNRITDNQFVALTGTDIVLLNYAGGLGIHDVVAHNSFLGNTGSSALLVIQQNIDGLTVQSNSFTDLDASGTAIEVHPTVNLLQIVDNDISVPNGGFFSDGILVDSGAPVGSSTMTIANNRIHTNGKGSGIEFTAEAPGFNLFAKVQGNDLQGNNSGVLIDAGLGGSVAGIDLGGGALGSWGANDFRGDSGGSFFNPNHAIYMNAGAAAGPVYAEGNIYDVADPNTVIFDHQDDASRGVVISGGALTGTVAYVQTLYLDFLHRIGEPNNPNDAGSWISAINQGTPLAAVASAIARSGEAAGIQVDSLYHRYLGRDADPAGRAGFVNYLSAGGSLEVVGAVMLGSQEYQGRFASDAAYVQSLYENLLHRVPTAGEIGGWLPLLPQLGRGGVAQAFLASQEFRGDEVRDDYRQLLSRTPSDGEVAGWVNSGLDLLTIDAYFASTTEFQTIG